jgi:dTDP-L-rhamnose 4-epimerase
MLFMHNEGMQKKLAVITGGAGFIGSHTADALAAKGYAIRIVDNLQAEVHGGAWPKYVRNRGYELVRADVREKKTWENILPGASLVAHLAAYQDQRLDFSTFFTTNTVSTALLYEVAVEQKFTIKKVIVASSQFVYGDGFYRVVGTNTLFAPRLRELSQFNKGEWDVRGPRGKAIKFVPFREDQQVFSPNSYALSKYALENLALRLGATYGIPTTAFRYSIVQGPRQSPKNLYSGAMRVFVSQALAGVPVSVYEDGNQTRDFVSVRDVVAANLLGLFDRRTDFEVYNVGGGKAYKVLDFAKKVIELTGAQVPIQVGAFRRTDTRHAVSDISKLKRLGWKPQFTIEDSIRDYAAWYMAEGFHKKADVAALKNVAKGIRR